MEAQRANGEAAATWILVATRRPGSPPVSDEASEPWRVALQAGPGTRTPAGRADESQRWQSRRAETVLAATVGRPTRRSRRLGRQRKASLGTLAALAAAPPVSHKRGTDRPLPLTNHARPGRATRARGAVDRASRRLARAWLALVVSMPCRGRARMRRSPPAATARTPRASTTPPIRETHVRPRRGPRAGRRSRDTRHRRDRARPRNRRRRTPRAADPSERAASGAAGSRGSGAPDVSEPGRSPAGWNARSTAGRAARAAPAAGPGTGRPPGRSRRHPASTSGGSIPLPASGHSASDAPRELPRPTRRPPAGAGRP